MAIQISGTTVIDNSRNLTNIVSYGGPGVATQAEAEAGTNNNQLMTPLRVKQSILANGQTTVINRVQRGSTSVSSPTQTVPWTSPLIGTNTASATVNASITSVNTGKAFVSQGARSTMVQQTRQQSTGSGTVIETVLVQATSGSARLASATAVSNTSGQGVVGVAGSPFTNYPALRFITTVDWEVIEFV